LLSSPSASGAGASPLGGVVARSRLTFAGFAAAAKPAKAKRKRPTTPPSGEAPAPEADGEESKPGDS